MKIIEIVVKHMADAKRAIPAWHNNISTISSNHTQVTGILAGFSATIVVLIVGLGTGSGYTPGGGAPGNVSLGIFAMAFFGYVAAGILFSITVEREGSHQYFLFSTASILYYFSGILSFSAVYPLILLIHSDPLKWGVRIMVVGGLFGGYLAAAIPLFDLLRIRLRYILGILAGSVIIGGASYVLLTFTFDVQTSSLLSWLLASCGLIVVIAFIFVSLTFFTKRLNDKGMYQVTSLILIALVTVTLCFAIIVGFRAKRSIQGPIPPPVTNTPLPK